MIKVFSKVIVTRVEVAFFDFIVQNLDFNSARHVPPYDKKKFDQKFSYIDRYYHKLEKIDLCMPQTNIQRFL